jgi:microcystin-dependent protein
MLLTNLTNQDYWFGPLHLLAGAGQTLPVDDTTATSLYLTDDTVADAINTLVASNKITQTGAAPPFPRATGVPALLHGDGSPEGVVYAGQGSVYLRRDNSGGSQLYQKTTGIHVNTGWTAFAGAVVTTPTGALLQYGAVTAPIGWLLCDGSAVSRSTYADLYNAIGTTFGLGDGSTTFNVPDMRGRVPVGYAAAGGHSDVSALNNDDGTALANRRARHRTSSSLAVSDTIGLSDPTHVHPTNIGGGGTNFTGQPLMISGNATNHSDSNPPLTFNTNAASTGITKTGTASLTGSIGTNVVNDPLDAPAYLVVNYIIKT